MGFMVNGKTYEFPTDLTLGEMCDAERYFGIEFGVDETVGVRMMTAMAWIAIRREDATVTIDDIRSLSPDVFEVVEEGDALPPESSGAGNGSAASSGEPSKNGSDDPAVVQPAITAGSLPVSATSSLTG